MVDAKSQSTQSMDGEEGLIGEQMWKHRTTPGHRVKSR
ncbi:hypothetical protein BH09PLA1_BH09PLA1_27410 [soil metagenome]